MKIEDKAKMIRLKELAMDKLHPPLVLDSKGVIALDTHIEDFYESEILGHSLPDDDIVILLTDAGEKFIRSYKKER